MASTSNNLSGVNNSNVILHLINDAIDDIDHTISDTAFNAANNPKYAVLYNYPEAYPKSTL